MVDAPPPAALIHPPSEMCSSALGEYYISMQWAYSNDHHQPKYLALKKTRQRVVSVSFGRKRAKFSEHEIVESVATSNVDDISHG